MSLIPEQATLKLSSPYKGLMPYTEEDADYFFGREVEKKIIAANLMVARLTLLYGESGVGKSSVLRAGVVQNLVEQATQKLDNYQRPGYAIVIFSNWQDDPVTGLLAEVEKAVTRLYARYDLVSPTFSGDLAETLAAWTEQEAIKGKLLIILDQFEEYFLYHPQEAEDSFVRQFSLAVNQTDLKVNFLISIREDQLSKLDRFKGRIPGLFENYIRIDYLNREAARRAIVEPIKKYNQEFGTEVTIEPELVEKVLDELEGGKVQITNEGNLPPGKVQEKKESGIETPYLQLVMTRLWDEEMRSGSSQIRLATLAKLKGAEQIVRSHLDEVLATLTPAELAVAAKIFRYLATPNGSKIAQSAADLAEFADLSSSEEKAKLGKVLEELSSGDNRILRPVQSPGGRADDTRYEIFHDVLGKAILEWRTRYVAEQKVLETERANRARIQRLLRLGGLGLILFILVGGMAIFSASSAIELGNERNSAINSRNTAEAERQDAIIARNEAESQKSNALSEAKIRAIAESNAKSQALAANALNQSETAPELAVLLALEANNTSRNNQSENALRQSLLALLSTRQLRIFKHSGMLRDSTFSPNGKLIATAGQDGTARLWDVETGEELQVLKGHTSIVSSVDFSYDSKYLVTASWDATVKVWDTNSGKEVFTLPSTFDTFFNFGVPRATFSPNGQYIVTTGTFTILWDISSTPKQIFKDGSVMYTASFNTDSSLIATGFGIYQTNNGKLVTPINQRQILRTAFSPDGQLLATASEDKTAVIWETKTGNKLHTLSAHNSTVRQASFSPDGKLLVTGGNDHNAMVWDVNTGAQLFVLSGHSDTVASAFFSPDGNYIITASGDNFNLGIDTTARLWDAHTGRLLTILSGHTSGLTKAKFSLDGKLVLTSSYDGTARTWLVRNSQDSIESFQNNLKVNKAVFSSDNKFLLISGTSSDLSNSTENPYSKFAPLKTQLWDTITGKLITQLDNFQIHLLSPDSKTVLVTEQFSEKVQLVNLNNNNEAKTLAGQPPGMTGYVFSSDGKLLATAGPDTTIRVWNSQTGALLTTLNGHKSGIIQIVFNSDNNLLASWSDGFIDSDPLSDNSVRLWKIPSGQLINTLPHPAPIREVLFSNDSAFIYTSTYKVAYSWAVDTGTQVHQYDGLSGRILFSPDRKILVTWNPQQMQANLQLQATKNVGVKVLSTVSNVELYSILNYPNGISSIIFSPDSRYLIIAGNDKSIRVLEARTGRLFFELEKSEDIVEYVTTSNDGILTAVITGNTIKLYNTPVLGTFDYV